MVSHMVLTIDEESSIKVVRALPPEEAREVLTWASHLADSSERPEIEWSDSWTDEDLPDATSAAIKRFEDHERDDR